MPGGIVHIWSDNNPCARAEHKTEYPQPNGLHARRNFVCHGINCGRAKFTHACTTPATINSKIGQCKSRPDRSQRDYAGRWAKH